MLTCQRLRESCVRQPQIPSLFSFQSAALPKVSSRHRAQQFTFENEAAFFVCQSSCQNNPPQRTVQVLTLLTGLISLVVLPAHRLIALFTYYVPHDMSACCHIPLHCLALPDIDNCGKQEGFAVLAAEVA
jgi:hypothetical protein